MYKNLFRIFLIFITTTTIFILYLSFFGIKTDKFNEFIKSEVSKKDTRFNIDLKDVFIKFNIKEKSLNLNSRDVIFFVNNEKQKIKNIDILVGIISIIKQEIKLKKVIINSTQNEISSLLKLIRAYKINIPILYFQNSVTGGKVIYDIHINFIENNKEQIEIFGKIIDTKLNILGREKLNDVKFDFFYKNKKIEIKNLKFNYKDINFLSKIINIDASNELINIQGDIKNKININFLSNFFKYDLKNYIDDNVQFLSKSNFNLIITKKFKIKSYRINSNLNIDQAIINLKNIHLTNYIKDFEKVLTLNNSSINLNIENDKINIKINSKFFLNKKDKPRNISLNYYNTGVVENYEFDIDLNENHLIFEQIKFEKKKYEKFLLNFTLNKKRDNYELINFNLYNDKNNFTLKNILFNDSFKIKDFSLIKASFHNQDGFLNDISFQKKMNEIKLISNKFDISPIIEENLKSKNNKNILDIFDNLNSSVDINIKSAKLDDQYSLNNLNGSSVIKKNKVNKTNLSAKFNDNKKFIYTKDKIDGKRVTTIYSDVAKPFVKKFNFLRGFEDGKLDFTSTKTNESFSKSELRIYDFKLKDMPVLTKLLSLASLQGIADLATGEGIRFNEFDMYFDNSDNLINIKEIYALGPAISILMEGYVEKNKLVSLRGTLVPATTINKTIAKIPLLGNILVGEKMGEGVFGVSFKIKGPPDDLDTRVNPIKTLTPRFITRTLDKIKKKTN